MNTCRTQIDEFVCAWIAAIWYATFSPEESPSSVCWITMYYIKAMPIVLLSKRCNLISVVLCEYKLAIFLSLAMRSRIEKSKKCWVHGVSSTCPTCTNTFRVNCWRDAQIEIPLQSLFLSISLTHSLSLSFPFSLSAHTYMVIFAASAWTF